MRVSFEDDDIVSNWLPVMVRKSLSDKESWPYEIQEHVFCMMDECLEYGIVTGAIYNDEDLPDEDETEGKFRKKFSDGSIIEYDKNAHKLTVDIQGEIIGKATTKITAQSPIIEATATTKITADAPEVKATGSTKVTIIAPLIELTGNVTLTGAATISGALIAASIATAGAGTISSSGNISTTGDVLAGGVSLKNHTHGGVQTGGGASGPPL